MTEDTCVWPKCRKRPEDADLPLCDAHAERTYDHMLSRLGQLQPPRTHLGPPANPNGIVYYLRVGDLVKVGFTTRMAERMSAYPPGAVLLAAEPGPKTLEAERHRELRHSLVRGREWFTPSPEVNDRVAAVLAEHGKPRQPQGRRVRHPVTVRRLDA